MTDYSRAIKAGGGEDIQARYLQTGDQFLMDITRPESRVEVIRTEIYNYEVEVWVTQLEGGTRRHLYAINRTLLGIIRSQGGGL